LMRQKIQNCNYMFDFSPGAELSSLKAREMKRTALRELVQLFELDPVTGAPQFQCTQLAFSMTLVGDMVNMFEINCLTRPRPPTSFGGADFDLEEDDCVLDPSWPHLMLALNAFFAYISNPLFDSHVGRLYLRQPFVLKVLQRLRSAEDFRERDWMKSILHRVYGILPSLRATIRKCIRDELLHFIYESQSHNGIEEIIEVVGSIIKGFATPIRAEHRRAFFDVILPLHAAKSINPFASQLSFCVVVYLSEKDPESLVPALEVLLRYWPKTNSVKQLFFLNEVNDLLIECTDYAFQEVLPILLKMLQYALRSKHFQVAERALLIMQSSFSMYMIMDSFVDSMGVLLNPLLEVGALSLVRRASLMLSLVWFFNASP
ncbi:uncharacterized protein MONBRDRAFT_14768, partial [Monosiga brevicollis MX1]